MAHIVLCLDHSTVCKRELRTPGLKTRLGKANDILRLEFNLKNKDANIFRFKPLFIPSRDIVIISHVVGSIYERAVSKTPLPCYPPGLVIP